MGGKRVLVAMSGGVDSSVAAHLLIQQGYECVGGTMRLTGDDGPRGVDGVTASAAEDGGCVSELRRSCGNERDIEDARAVARALGIPFHVFDCRAAFDRDVVEAFVQAYERGVTPNPCALCNLRIKFGLLLECARSLGCDLLATGHYAQVRVRPGGQPEGKPVCELAKAQDPTKDQSYFLYGLGQDVLTHVVFPLGNLTKEGDVRRIAQELGLATARKRDSQGICFVEGNDFASFIEQRRGRALPEGDILATDGRVLGRHRGAIRYTVGQRKGLGVASTHPLYVTAIDARANTVTLGDVEDLYANTLVATDWVWSAPAPELNRELDAATAAGTGLAACAQIRYHQPDQEVCLFRADAEDGGAAGAGQVRVVFATPQRGIAPGQAVVVYRGDVVLGGGTVVRAGRTA